MKMANALGIQAEAMMSNTGHKGIYSIWMGGRGYYKVAVMWRKRSKNAFIRKTHYDDPLQEAIRVRNKIEQELGKPRTEKSIHSGGVMNQPNGNVIEWEYK